MPPNTCQLPVIVEISCLNQSSFAVKFPQNCSKAGLGTLKEIQENLGRVLMYHDTIGKQGENYFPTAPDRGQTIRME